MTNSLLAGVDDRVNFGYATVAAAPVPAVSGTKLTVTAGPRPAPPFYLSVYSSTAPRPLQTNAEILRCTKDDGGELTVARAQQESTARGIAGGDIVLIGETRDSLRQLEQAFLNELHGRSFDARDYGAKIDGKRFKGVTSTAAGAEVTVPGAAFTSADVGKVGMVYKDFESGTIRTIESVIDATHVKLSGTAGITAAANGYFLYGTDDSAALAALLAAAKPEAAVAEGFNEPIGGGHSLAVIPSVGQGFSMVASQLTVPSGVQLDCRAFLVNVMASRTNPLLIFSPYTSYRELKIECLFGSGVQLGTGAQADVHGHDLRLWQAGIGGVGEGLILSGSGFLLDLVWMKGSATGINFNSGSDCTINRAHLIGCQQPVVMTASNQVRAFFILDSCGRNATEVGEKGAVDGISLDKACSDVNIEFQAFEVGTVTPPRKLAAVVAVGRKFVSGGNSIGLKIRGQAALTGGLLMFLAHCEDVEAIVQGSNKQTPSSAAPEAANEITFAVEYGVNAEGAIRIIGSGSSSIKPFAGTMAGTFDWMQKGVNYRYQSYGFAPTITAGANAGGAAPAPGKTDASDQTGFVTFGTGTAPAAGEQVKVTFANGAANFGYLKAPKVMITPRNAASAALGLYVNNEATTGFSVACGNAPAASQANTTYAFSYAIVG